MSDNPSAFQERVGQWMVETFSGEICQDPMERAMRFLEEATELCQAMGMTGEQAATITRYVYGRPVGEPSAEVGGAMVTLAALCWATGMDMAECGTIEIDRIDTPEMRAKIASKHVSKKMFGIVSNNDAARAGGA